MKAIFTLALKDLRLLSRDHFAMFWVLIFPLLMALFFGSIFGSGGSGRAKMTVVMVDHDQSDYSQSFIEEFGNSNAVNLTTSTLDSARSKVRRGKAVAYLLLKKGVGEFESLFRGDSALIEAGVDPVRKAEAGLLQGLIMQAWFKTMQSSFLNPQVAMQRLPGFLDDISNDSNLSTDQKSAMTTFFSGLNNYMYELDSGALAVNSATEADSSEAEATAGFGPKIDYKEMTNERITPRSSWEITFPQSIMWGLIGVAAAFGISIVTERTKGTMIRLQLAPISRGQILAGKGLACMLFCLAVNVSLLGFAKLVFGIRTPDPLMLAAAVLATAFCFTGMMMFISVLGKTEQAVGGAGWAILLVFSMTGGGMIPLMAMPGWMVTISHISPVKWGIYALEGAIWRGFGFSEMMLPLGILLGFGIVTFSIGVIKFNRTTL